jgi:hypothetical protein
VNETVDTFRFEWQEDEQVRQSSALSEISQSKYTFRILPIRISLSNVCLAPSSSNLFVSFLVFFSCFDGVTKRTLFMYCGTSLSGGVSNPRPTTVYHTPPSYTTHSALLKFFVYIFKCTLALFNLFIFTLLISIHYLFVFRIVLY